MQDPGNLLYSCVTIQEWGWLKSQALRIRSVVFKLQIL
jgi:hypothetical protein